MAAIYLLRHGQASFGADDYDALSPLGVEQSRRLGEALAGCGLRSPVLVSGSMRRHRETLAGCLAALNAAEPVVIDADWDEYDHEAVLVAADPAHPDLAALQAALAAHPDPKAEFQRIFAVAMTRWAGGAHDRDYAETWTGFQQRVARALTTLVRRLPHDRDAVVSTSGGVIAAVVQQLLEMPAAQGVALNWTLVNAGYTRLRTGKGGPRLCCLNVHSHFERDRRLVSYR